MKSAVIIPLLFLATGCQTRETEVTPKQAAIRHVNQQQYDEAIAILDPLVKKNPADEESRILLASSYVGSAGFDVIESFEFFIKFVHDGDSKSLKLLAEDPARPDPRNFEATFVAFLADYADVLEQIAVIPYIKEEQKRNKVNQALVHLGEIPVGSDLYLRARLYSAYLNVFQYLNYMRDAVPAFNPKEKLSFRSFVCKVNVAVLVQNLDKSSGYLLHGLDDARAAMEFRKKALPSVLKTASEVAQSIRDGIKKYQFDVLSSLTASTINDLKKRGICN
jgi:hypothetical protein